MSVPRAIHGMQWQSHACRYLSWLMRAWLIMVWQFVRVGENVASHSREMTAQEEPMHAYHRNLTRAFDPVCVNANAQPGTELEHGATSRGCVDTSMSHVHFVCWCMLSPCVLTIFVPMAKLSLAQSQSTRATPHEGVLTTFVPVIASTFCAPHPALCCDRCDTSAPISEPLVDAPPTPPPPPTPDATFDTLGAGRSAEYKDPPRGAFFWPTGTERTIKPVAVVAVAPLGEGLRYTCPWSPAYCSVPPNVGPVAPIAGTGEPPDPPGGGGAWM